MVAAAGAVKHEELVKLAEKAFGAVKTGTPKSYATKPYFCGAQALRLRMSINIPHINESLL